MKKSFLFLLVFSIALLGGLLGTIAHETDTGEHGKSSDHSGHYVTEEGEYHIHADFKVFIHGEPLNFSREEFMSDMNHSLHGYVHLHDMDGSVIHAHAPNQTLHSFFSSLGMVFNETCFRDEKDQAYCTDDEAELLLYVNGSQNMEYGKYVFSDLDRILITYGTLSSSDLQNQLDAVTDRACIASGKCPERGSPTGTESCSDGKCTVSLN